MEHLMAKLALNSNLCYIRSTKDAVIHYDKICRTCLGTHNVVSIFNITYENLNFTDLLEQHVSIQVQDNDTLPTQICDSCITKLINLHLFKKKCLQTQVTLKEIINYNEARAAGHQYSNSIQVPFILQEVLRQTSIPENSQNKEITKISLNKIVKNNDSANVRQIVGNKLWHAKKNLDKIINSTEQQIQEIIEDSHISLPSTNINDGKELNQELLPKEGNNNIAETKHKDIKSVNFKEQKTDNKVVLGEQKVKVQRQHKKSVCNVCKEMFDSIKDLKQHREDAQHLRAKRKTACHICGKVIGCHLNSHLRTHTLEKPYKCNICSKAFTVGSNLQRHIKTHSGEKPFMCEICGKGYSRMDILKEHKVIHSGEFPYRCDYCGKAFNHVMKYRAHIRKHKMKNVEAGGQLSEADAKKLAACTCEICHKTYSSRAALYAHKLIHGDRTFTCKECGKKFRTPAVLYYHCRTHTGERPYSCEICGKTYTTASALKLHNFVHSGEKPYSCKTCAKSFKQRTHLQHHMRTHSGEKPYKCELCGKCFALKGNLVVHIRTHTGETPYVCDICDKGFYDSSSLKKHRKVHTKS